MIRKIATTAIILLLICNVLIAANKRILPTENNQEYIETDALVKRIMPQKYWKYFKIKLIPQSANQKDYFSIESQNNKIILSGNNGVSVASALNYYLKEYTKCQITWNGVNMNLPKKLPHLPQKITKETVFDRRYYINYCTYSYSMAWWDWERWQKEIDWMAMHGINMPLTIIGQNSVWYSVYKSMGISDKDLSSFFSGPAHYAWFWMGNIDAVGGPLSHQMMDKQEELQKKILQRERALGMKAILSAFTGHVPEAFRQKYPNAKLKEITWGNRYHTCLLDPSDSLFAEIGKRFIKEQIKTFGTDHLYSADTFNENAPPSNDSTFLSKVSKMVYKSMADVDDKAVWVMQGWLFVNNPTFWKPPQIKALLNSIPNDKMIVLDLWSETRPVWKLTESYYGKPWIWCMLQNFGGNVGMFGRMDTVAKVPFKSFQSKNKGDLVGIGLTPEGIEQNPVMFELMMDNLWNHEAINVDDWLKKYIEIRYGKTPTEALNAWQILRKTVYNGGGSQGAPESILSGRPTLKKEPRWTRIEKNYRSKDLLPAWQKMIGLADELKNSDGFQYDIVDITRQVLADYCTDLRQEMVLDYQQKNKAAFISKSKIFIGILNDMDELLSTRTDFLLGKWINDAQKWGDTPEEKQLQERNAKLLITLWSDKDALLHDYACKQWAGMLGSFYKPRWEQFFTETTHCLETNTPFDEDLFNEKMKDWEWKWVNNNQTYAATPNGNSIAVAQKIFTKYEYLLTQK